MSELIDYLILAQFDIDKGSSIKFQYPRETGVDPQYLAEMMLPDGVHKRDEDWTLFKLSVPTGGADASARDVIMKQVQMPMEDFLNSPLYSPFETSVYEFDETQQQGWVPRGNKAVVVFPDRMEIRELTDLDGPATYSVTRHADLDYTQLEPLFAAVLTATGLALGFRFGAPEAEQVFSAQVADIRNGVLPQPPVIEIPDEEAMAIRTASTASSHAQSELWCINRVSVDRRADVRRGAVVRALAICTSTQFFHQFKPFLVLALELLSTASNDADEFNRAAEFYSAMNAVHLGAVPQLDLATRKCLRGAERHRREQEVTVTYMSKQMKLKVPFTMLPEEMGETFIVELVRKFGAQCMVLFNAVVLQKRVLFLGHDMPAHEVCHAVVSTAAMVCPPLVGVHARAFPYRNLSSLDFLQVPGYIAGVANPMFESHHDWWDVCCNLATGKIAINPSGFKEPAGCARVDAEFYRTVEAAVADRYGEEYIVNMFRGYTARLVDLAYDDAEFANANARAMEVEANRARIEAWRASPSFATFDVMRRSIKPHIADRNIKKYVNALMVRKDMGAGELVGMLQAMLANVTSPDEIVEFVSMFSDVTGIEPLGVLLFAADGNVRQLAQELVRRIVGYEQDYGSLRGVNPYFKASLATK